MDGDGQKAFSPVMPRLGSRTANSLQIPCKFF